MIEMRRLYFELLKGRQSRPFSFRRELEMGFEGGACQKTVRGTVFPRRDRRSVSRRILRRLTRATENRIPRPGGTE